MRKGEIEALMKSIAPVLRRWLSDQLEPLRTRIEELERRADDAEARGLNYAGAWQRAATYKRGDVVTCGGSMWVAIQATEPGQAPGETMAWQLAVKRGRDGKDAR